ncbi:MAG: YiiD C-terminal domain-containing protein [Ignavibacteria bacterium]|jgi:thioesterase domain-containing protein
MLTNEDVKNYLYENIPITKHLGIEVKEFSDLSIKLYAPLEKNINHRESAFGGSISSLVILSGWTLLHLKLLEAGIDCHLVIQKSTTDFLLPAFADFETECKILNEDVWDVFLYILEKKNKSRIILKSQVSSENKVIGTHEGVYVALDVRK